MLLQCPHCQDIVDIIEENCRIFRHGVLKSNLQQINPHTNKEECERLTDNNLIYGCGKPFRLIRQHGSASVGQHGNDDNGVKLIECDYI